MSRVICVILPEHALDVLLIILFIHVDPVLDFLFVVFGLSILAEAFNDFLDLLRLNRVGDRRLNLLIF